VTRMIERWFPCTEVSANSDSGWGSGNTERNLFTWFAARPTAQAKAAVICSLLPWPEEAAEQERLQDLVRGAMTGRYEKWAELRKELLIANPEGASVLDPFSGRGMIPLEAARLGLPAYAIDYSPIAVMASEVLADYPFRDWTAEPPLPFQGADESLVDAEPRLLRDLRILFGEVGRRFTDSLAEFYPQVSGKQPWGYLWAVTLPCQECGRRFPLVGKYDLRPPRVKRGINGRPEETDPGQSFFIEADLDSGRFAAVVVDGEPRQAPTLANAVVNGRKVAGKSARCSFCGHNHPLPVHRRLTNDGHGRDVLLVVADLDEHWGKSYRIPTDAEHAAAEAATAALAHEAPFSPLMPAVPSERIAPGNNNIIGPSIYGARTFGDLMCDRQTLSYVRLARIAVAIAAELTRAGIGEAYTRALLSYVSATVVRKLRYSTRGAWLHHNRQCVAGIFINEGSLSFSYDFFEVGIGDGPSTWDSVSSSSLNVLRGLIPEKPGLPAEIRRGSAVSLPWKAGRFDSVVTDPPYDEMVAYGDSSDIFYSWLKRVMADAWPQFALTNDPGGAQDKTDEIIVKRVRGEAPNEHRTREHYDAKIAAAFKEMRRVVRDDGLVTIVFGHGEPEVWQRLLGSITSAGLVMTGSWPASTEAGGMQGKANIATTLTMSCRPASADRPTGRRAAVEAEIKAEIKRRYPDWDRWGLAPADMLMAASGPAMEIVGRYSMVLDARAEPVDISTFLPLARAAVQEAMALEIDHHPLETFDARTRFALWWVRLYGRDLAAKSELRWQTLAASLDLADVRNLIPDADKGCRFTTAFQFAGAIVHESAVIDVALAMAKAQEEGLHAVGEVLLASGRDAEDPYLWAAISFLADRLPGSDPDGIAWTRILRNRSGVGSAARAVIAERVTADTQRLTDESQLKLL
jgi:putative DNA methylase